MSASVSGPAGNFQFRQINVTFVLGTSTAGGASVPSQQTFAGSSSNTLTLTGPRVSAIINQAGGISQGQLDLRIFGLTQSHMNSLTVLQGPRIIQPGYSVTVSAGTQPSGMAIVYSGNILRSFPDYEGAPDVALHVTSLSAIASALQSIPPSSYQGSADVATIMANLARVSNPPLLFENNGVSVRLSNPYFWGSTLSQIEACAEAAGIGHAIVTGGDGQKILAIWPAGGSRGGQIPLISPQTGLRAYPTPTPLGVDFTTVFNPSIQFRSNVKIQSDIANCCGVWTVKQMSHTLESQTPDGAWFSRVSCVAQGTI